jgi:hypothetical protein
VAKAKKKKRKRPEFILTETQCASVLQTAIYLESGLISFDPKAVQKLSREIARVTGIGVRGATPSSATRRLREQIPRVNSETLCLLGRALAMIKGGADARLVFRQHLVKKPATHQGFFASTMADYYYEQRARLGPAVSDILVLRGIRRAVTDFRHLQDAGLRRLLRRHRDRAMADLRERAERQAQGIAPGTASSNDAPTLEQVKDLEEHLRRRSARGE